MFFEEGLIYTITSMDTGGIYLDGKSKVVWRNQLGLVVEEAQEPELVEVESKYVIKLSGYRKTITENQARQLRDELTELLND
jgi:hypothetical protein